MRGPKKPWRARYLLSSRPLPLCLRDCMVPNTRSTGPLVLPSTFQFAKPLQVHYVFGNPGVWVHTEVGLREGSPSVPTPSSVSGCYPRNEWELEDFTTNPQSKAQTLTVGWAHPPPWGTLAIDQAPFQLGRELWIWSMKEQGSTFFKPGIQKLYLQSIC